MKLTGAPICVDGYHIGNIMHGALVVWPDGKHELRIEIKPDWVGIWGLQAELCDGENEMFGEDD